jgi:hypothetical protein
MALQRGANSAGDLAAQYEVVRWKLYRELAAERTALEEQRRLADQAARTAAESRTVELAAQLEAAEARLAEWSAVQARSGWRLFVAAAGLRRRLGPPGTARDAGLRRILRAAAAAADTAHLTLERARSRRRRAR